MLSHSRWWSACCGLLASALLSALAEPAHAAPAAECRPSAETNRRIVLDFYQTGLVGLKPREAFGRHVSSDFVEHKPDVEGGTREAVVAYLEALIKSVPRPKWEVLRTVAEDDLVFLHATFTPAPGAPAYVIADIFRLKNCLIVEHWDIVAGPPQKQLNPNPRF